MERCRATSSAAKMTEEKKEKRKTVQDNTASSVVTSSSMSPDVRVIQISVLQTVRRLLLSWCHVSQMTYITT